MSIVTARAATADELASRRAQAAAATARPGGDRRGRKGSRSQQRRRAIARELR
ncbi:hypothetical protein [Dietzia sp. 179-F 9C3 NHS]|uniref:hypothetical protein n=1 Tax=Dietzia sp. 179-F 9C3 NHS TaxID=3374295 RepID=UPI00387A39B2